MRRALVAAALVAALAAPTPVGLAAEPVEIEARQPVIGLSFRGAHRAYPLALFAARRVLNDVVGGMEIAVFHDPEGGASAAWFRSVLGEPIEFSGAAAGGVADDLTTITRWDMATGVAVSGNLEGQRLPPLAVTKTSWAEWTAAHPGATAFGQAR